MFSQYWPAYKSRKAYGRITVRCIEEQRAISDYIVRTLEVRQVCAATYKTLIVLNLK